MKSRSLPALFAGAVVLALIIAALAYWLFERVIAPPPPMATAPVIEAPLVAPAPAVTTPKEIEPEGAVVINLRGQVEHSNDRRAWEPVRVGDRLHADESLRTGPQSSAELQVDARSHLSVADRSELKVREVTAASHRFRLARGRIAVDYEPDGKRVLKIEGDVGDAAAETKGAKFSVLSTGTTFAVASQSGTVDLHAADANVRVEAGQQALTREGQAPTVAAAIPVEVLLKVARAGAPTEALCAMVSGTASPGAEVWVDGKPVELSVNGKFEERVARRQGMSGVRVVTRDASGREREETVPCSVLAKKDDDEAELKKFELKWE